MAQNINNKTIDDVLKDLDTIFKDNYLGYKKYATPYKELTEKVESLKNVRCKSGVLCALENKINSQEDFIELATNIWNTLFVCIELLLTIITSISINIYDNPNLVLSILGIITTLLIILYCLATKSLRKKTKEKNFFKYVEELLK